MVYTIGWQSRSAVIKWNILLNDGHCIVTQPHCFSVCTIEVFLDESARQNINYILEYGLYSATLGRCRLWVNGEFMGLQLQKLW